MGYLNCESAKDLIRMCLFEKNVVIILFILFWKIVQAWFFLPCYTSFPRVYLSNSATAGPQPGMKKEEGLNHTEHTGKSQKVSL